MPSDWDAQHLNGKCSPATVEDLKVAVDAVLLKKGIFSLCFHTHGWIRNDQVIEMIDYAAEKHGDKVKFLSFREVQERLDKNLLGGQPLRAQNGQDNGVRLIDVDGDGFLDVVIGNEHVRITRVWSARHKKWVTHAFPMQLVHIDDQGNRSDGGARFGVLDATENASVFSVSDTATGTWRFASDGWEEIRHSLGDLIQNRSILLTARDGRDRGSRLRDLDGDGICELIVSNRSQNAVFRWSADDQSWNRLPIRLPKGTSIVDRSGRDAGLRFVDVNQDGLADIVYSNAQSYAVHPFISLSEGWAEPSFAGKRGDQAADNEVPMIVRADHTNNGVWFNYQHMWVQNEDTGKSKPDHVDRRSYDALCGRTK
jgi:hypothetical protein